MHSVPIQPFWTGEQMHSGSRTTFKDGEPDAFENALSTRVKPVLATHKPLSNIVEANITRVSEGSKEQFNVVSVARSFNGRTATGTAIREVNSVRELHRPPTRPPPPPSKKEAP